jgi:hypothetical protein
MTKETISGHVSSMAIAAYQNKEVNIPLLKNRMGAATTEMVIGSVQHLEYSISDDNKSDHGEEKTVAVMKRRTKTHKDTGQLSLSRRR